MANGDLAFWPKLRDGIQAWSSAAAVIGMLCTGGYVLFNGSYAGGKTVQANADAVSALVQQVDRLVAIVNTDHDRIQFNRYDLDHVIKQGDEHEARLHAHDEAFQVTTKAIADQETDISRLWDYLDSNYEYELNSRKEMMHRLPGVIPKHQPKEP